MPNDHIIIKKMRNFLNVSSDVITFGDVRSQMASDLLKTLTDIINKKSDYGKPYWLLVYSNIDPSAPSGNVIKERVMILPEKPQAKYIGTCLFRIDPVHGDAEVEYILPLDIKTPSFIVPEAGRVGPLKRGEVSILESAKNLPIFHRRVA